MPPGKEICGALKYDNTVRAVVMPLALGLALACGILIGRFARFTGWHDGKLGYGFGRKMEDIRQFLLNNYVDSLDAEDLDGLAINALLESLDPHSGYIRPKDYEAAYEDLHGTFEGIGIEFNILADTIVVVSVIPGGPSELSGILPGDRIIRVDDTLVAGVGITSDQVMKLLRGPKGTQVKVELVRAGGRPFTVTLRRAKIPVNSVEAALSIDKTGYIRLSRFSDDTFNEFLQAFKKLDSADIEALILDLRNNPGGLLDQAVAVADFFLPKGTLIVSTRGAHRKEVRYMSQNRFGYSDIPLAVLINRGSASASEIVAAALQDNDRALIAGEPSFGKGLVQEEITFPDGSALRITVARYYTPSGRCIQRDYEEVNSFKYYHRFPPGDTIQKTTSDPKPYSTRGGRSVYAGGGIMPDVIANAQMDKEMDLLSVNPTLASRLNEFALEQADRHREIWKKKYPTYKAFFKDALQLSRLVEAFSERVADIFLSQEDNEKIPHLLKALVARYVWGNEAFYFITLQHDILFKQVLSQLKNNNFRPSKNSVNE
ncbi:MAG: S41 family peptidase [Flavobacteriales bacterium]|nr:S41 family peptidase [Flavobacteriales bacterium]MDW8410252.1 S41 family peptidase [Flavobacteriales bacterium]